MSLIIFPIFEIWNHASNLNIFINYNNNQKIDYDHDYSEHTERKVCPVYYIKTKWKVFRWSSFAELLFFLNISGCNSNWKNVSAKIFVYSEFPITIEPCSISITIIEGYDDVKKNERFINLVILFKRQRNCEVNE